MSFSETIKSKWNEKFDRHAIGVLAHDGIERTLTALDRIDAKRAVLVGDVNLSPRGVSAEIAKTAATEAKTVEQARRVLSMGRANVRDQRLALVPKPANKDNVADLMRRQELRSILRQKTFAELLTLFGAEHTPREIYETYFESPAATLGITEQQRDQLIEITVQRIGGPQLGAIAEQSDALDLLEASTRRASEELCRCAAIQPHAYAEWCQKIGATVDDVAIAAEKAEFESQITAPVVELTPLVVRSQAVRELLENGVA